MKSKTSLRETFGIHEPGMYEKKYLGTDQMSFEQFMLIPKRLKNHKYLRSIQNYLLNKQTINLVGTG
jgi:hypothetical protein